MLQTLLPFPRYRRLEFGLVVNDLPSTRDGIRDLPATTFGGQSHNCFAHLSIERYASGKRCRGICGLLPSAAFRDGSIRPHEATLLKRLERQENLVVPDGGALGKPVLLTVPSLKAWWARNDQQFNLEEQRLEMVGLDNKYVLQDYRAKAPGQKGGEGFSSALALDIPGPLVIADGHHRAETHARLDARGVPGFAHVPVCLIGADELHIGVFARVLAPAVATTTLGWLQANFSVKEIDKPLAPAAVGEWLLLHAGRYYRLHRRIVAGETTDVDWLNQFVLPSACGITDARQDERITFEPAGDPTEKGLISDTFDPAHLVLISYPLPKERFFAEVAAGRTLPPKSTRFEPRVPSGLVVWEGG